MHLLFVFCVLNMQPAPNKKSLWKRQIPTILGLSILVFALVAGLLFFSQGTGVFAPRATPQTTPKDIKLTNVTDNSFTVSFLTDESTAGFVKYGTEAKSLSSQSSDDRDQLSGSVGTFPLHHVTIRGLQPNTTYYYVLGTGSQASFDNQGQPFSVKTAQRSGAPSAAKTIYGNILNETGGPAEGSIVYISVDGVGEMSSLVKGSGSWAVPLSNARTSDGSSYAEITDETTITLRAQGPSATQKSELTTTVAEAQPVPPITFGQDPSLTAEVPNPTEDPTLMEEPLGDEPVEEPVEETPDDSVANADTATDSATPVTTGGLSSLNEAVSSSQSASTASTSAVASATVIDLQKGNTQTVTTSQPTIKGVAVPNVVVTISVHSDTQIQQQLTTDANGQFVLDISTLEQQLEPGEHTVEYSYTDPTTGQTVTKTQTFTVKGTATQLAAANTSGTGDTNTMPYGSGNPYPIGGATTSASPTPTPTATMSATPSARRSQPSTASGVPVSGSVGTTLALVIGGLFFTITGLWSFWVSQQLQEKHAQD